MLEKPPISMYRAERPKTVFVLSINDLSSLLQHILVLCLPSITHLGKKRLTPKFRLTFYADKPTFHQNLAI